MWFWERYGENFSPNLNQLLQAVNPYFWKVIPSFPTLSALVPSQTCPLHKQDAGIVFSSRTPGRRAHGAVGGRQGSSCAAAKSKALRSLCFSSHCISHPMSPCLHNVLGRLRGRGRTERGRGGAPAAPRGFPVSRSEPGAAC